MCSRFLGCPDIVNICATHAYTLARERRTELGLANILIAQVLRVDCRDSCHGRLDNARLVHYLLCEIIRTFGMPQKMPDRPGLSNRYVVVVHEMPTKNRPPYPD